MLKKLLVTILCVASLSCGPPQPRLVEGGLYVTPTDRNGHDLSVPEFLLLGSGLALPASAAAFFLSFGHLRVRLRPPLRKWRAAGLALAAGVVTMSSSFLLWPLMDVVWLPESWFAMVIIMLHPPAWLAAVLVLSLGYPLVHRFFRHPAGDAAPGRSTPA